MSGIGNEGGTVTCDEARALTIDGLTRSLQPAESRSLGEHLASCESCRIAGEELRVLWKELAELPTPRARSDAQARFRLALDGAAAAESAVSIDRAPRRLWRWSAAAASLFIAAALGYTAGAAFPRGERPIAAATSTSPGGMYLLLLHVREMPGAVRRPADEARIVAEYARWARGLSEAGKLVVAEKLADAPAEVLGPGMPSADNDRIGGFFLIRASSFEEAQRIASDCPHLQYGGRVELRAIEPT